MPSLLESGVLGEGMVTDKEVKLSGVICLLATGHRFFVLI